MDFKFIHAAEQLTRCLVNANDPELKATVTAIRPAVTQTIGAKNCNGTSRAGHGRPLTGNQLD